MDSAFCHRDMVIKQRSFPACIEALGKGKEGGTKGTNVCKQITLVFDTKDSRVFFLAPPLNKFWDWHMQDFCPFNELQIRFYIKCHIDFLLRLNTALVSLHSIHCNCVLG